MTYKPLSWYVPGKVVYVNDKMQKGYNYTLTKSVGNFKDHPEFKPYYTPQQMLKMGIFRGRYLNDCKNELPKEFYEHAKLSLIGDVTLNYFGVESCMSLTEWRKRGWIYGDDPRGWFQWYVRFYLGRRDPEIDKIQISRWRCIKRHAAQVEKSAKPGMTTAQKMKHRPKQRQVLLSWSYNCMI